MKNNNSSNTQGGAYVQDNVNVGRDFIGRDSIVIQLQLLEKDALEYVLSTLESLRTTDLSDKQYLFERHIEPTFRMLEQVHKDYEKTLFELRGQLSTRQSKLKQIAEWFMGRSLMLRAEREYLKQINTELDIVRARIDYEISSTAKFDSEFALAVHQFSSAVINYFNFSFNEAIADSLAMPLIAGVNYSGFTFFNVALQAYAIGRVRKSVFDNLIRILDKVIQFEIKANWSRVSLEYLRLRGICLV